MIRHIDRRTALAGMGATVVGLGTAESAAASAKESGAETVAAQLKELSNQYIQAAKLIDPTINCGWTGHDTSEEQLVFSVYLERKDAPLLK